MQLRADEAAVVEKAVRLAIESVMNVLCAVNSARTHELQRLVADRERQIRRLEAELGLLLRPRSPGSSPGRGQEQRGGAEPESGAEQREQRDCEVRVSLALLTDPTSDLADGAELDQSSSSVSEPPLCSGPGPHCPPEAHVPPEQNCPAEEGRVREQPRPAERRVKQERFYPSPGRVKPEPLSPESLPQDPQDGAALGLRRTGAEESPRGQGVLGHAELWPGVSSQPEDTVPVPVPHHLAPVPHPSPVPQTSHSQTSQSVPWRRGVPRRDQSEEAMRRRRASWRAASRRYYARKMARLQNHGGVGHAPGLHSPASSSAHQYPPCSGGPGPAPHTDSWRYQVCDMAPPPSDITFMAESDLLSGSLT